MIRAENDFEMFYGTCSRFEERLGMLEILCGHLDRCWVLKLENKFGERLYNSLGDSIVVFQASCF